jgi:hypothetical protein
VSAGRRRPPWLLMIVLALATVGLVGWWRDG